MTPALAGAARAVLGFRTLSNQPLPISMLNQVFKSGAYRAKVLKYAQAVMDEYMHVLSESLGLMGHALEQARAIGDSARISHILANLGALATAGRDFEGAQSLLREGLDLARTLDQPENLILLLINSGQLAKERGDIEGAIQSTSEALQRATASGHARYAELAHAYLDELQSLDGN